MVDNVVGSKNRAKAFKTDRGSFPTENGPFIATVMSNEDPSRAGRVQVLLDSFSADLEREDVGIDAVYSEPLDKQSNWITVRYLSPFYGVTKHKKYTGGKPDFKQSAQSYGMWFNTPDIGAKVLVFFADGDPDLGYYIGFIPEMQLNHCTPAAGAREPNHIIYNSPAQEVAFEKAHQLPVTEILMSEENMKNKDFYDEPKAVHSVLAAQMWQAGTLVDNVRGPIGTSSQRESPSYAYGVNTPGRPIYSSGLNEDTVNAANKVADLETAADYKEKAEQVEGRRGGHSFIMDDGSIEGNDTLIRLRTSTGHQITMSDDGKAVYIAHANGQSWLELGNEGTFDVFTENSVNIRSKGKLNFHADDDINFHAGGKINMFSGDNIQIEADHRVKIIGKQEVAVHSNIVLNMSSFGSIHTDSIARTTMRASANVVVTGATIQLNSLPADAVFPPDNLDHNFLDDTTRSTIYGWVNDSEKLDTIVTRAPAHEPYAYHCEGDPIPADYGPTAATPVPPIGTAAKIDAVAKKPVPKATVDKAITAMVAAKVGDIRSIGNINKAGVVAMLGQRAASVAQDATSITEQGVGLFGIPGKILGSLGITKPGLFDFVNATAAGLQTFLSDPSVFTGMYGITSIDSLLNDVNIQGKILQDSMVSTLGELVQSGNLVGTESGKALASVLSTSFEADPSEIKSWLNNTGSSLLANSLDGVSREAQYAIDFAETKLSSLAGLLGGSVSSIGSQAQTAINTVNRAGLDQTYDVLIDDPRIPSAVVKTLLPATGIDIASVPSLQSLSGLGSDILGTLTAGLDSGLAGLATSAITGAIPGQATQAVQRITRLI